MKGEMKWSPVLSVIELNSESLEQYPAAVLRTFAAKSTRINIFVRTKNYKERLFCQKYKEKVFLAFPNLSSNIGKLKKTGIQGQRGLQTGELAARKKAQRVLDPGGPTFA